MKIGVEVFIYRLYDINSIFIEIWNFGEILCAQFACGINGMSMITENALSGLITGSCLSQQPLSMVCTGGLCT